MSTLGERIKEVRKRFNFDTQKKLSKELGFDEDSQLIQNLESGRTKNLDVEVAIRFEVILKVNPWWLMSGQGEMLLSDGNSIGTLYLDSEFQIKLLPGTTDKSRVCLDKYFLQNLSIASHNLRAIRMIGDSMSPTLNNGDCIIIDTTEKAAIDGLYAIMVEEEFSIKRLSFTLDGSIEMISDNTAYKMRTCKRDAIEIIGMAILIIKSC